MHYVLVLYTYNVASVVVYSPMVETIKPCRGIGVGATVAPELWAYCGRHEPSSRVRRVDAALLQSLFQVLDLICLGLDLIFLGLVMILQIHDLVLLRLGLGKRVRSCSRY